MCKTGEEPLSSAAEIANNLIEKWAKDLNRHVSKDTQMASRCRKRHTVSVTSDQGPSSGRPGAARLAELLCGHAAHVQTPLGHFSCPVLGGESSKELSLNFPTCQ